MDAATLELYDELDSILAEQERDKFASKSLRIMLAKDFNRNLMNLYKVEEMWRVLQLGFSRYLFPHIQDSLRNFSTTGKQEVNRKSLAEILNSFDMRVTEETLGHIFKESTEGSHKGVVTPESMLVHSYTFQNLMLQDDADDVAQLLYRSHVLRTLSWQSMQLLCPSVRRISLRPGQVIRLRERSIIAVQAGSISVTYRIDSTDSGQGAAGKSPLMPRSGSSKSTSVQQAQSAQSSPLNGAIDRAGSQDHFLHTAQFERDQVAAETWAILNMAQVVSVTTDVNTAILLLPWTSFGVMLEMHPEIYRTLCSTIVDLTYDVTTGDRLKSDFLLQPFETELVYDLYMTTTKKGAKKLRNGARESQAAPDLDDLESAFQKAKDKTQQDRDGAVRSLMERTRETMAMEWSDSQLKPAILAFCRWKASFKSKRVKKFESVEHEARMTLRSGFEIVEGSWSVIANGANTIYLTVCYEVYGAHLRSVAGGKVPMGR